MAKNNLNIEQEIKDNGFTIAQIARLLGKTRPTVYDWISGGDPEHIEQIRSIMKSQNGSNNTYNDGSLNGELIKVLKDVIAQQKEHIQYLQEECRSWKERCENCEKRSAK